MLPSIEERGLGVREYWYETFRRVVVVPLAESGCFLLSVDVYRLAEGVEEERVVGELAVGEDDVRLVYLRLGEEEVSRLSLRGLKPVSGEVVAVVSSGGERVELSNVRLVYCGLDSVPGYDEVWHVYREAVLLVEGRDPEKEPLDALLEEERSSP